MRWFRFLLCLFLVISSASADDTPIICGGALNQWGTFDTNYFALTGTDANNLTTDSRRVTIPIAGTFSKLYVSIATDPSPGSYLVRILKNGVATSITCTVPAGSTTCNDTTHSVAVSPGDTLSGSGTAVGSPPASGSTRVGILFSSTNPGEGLILALAGNMSSSATRYFGIQGDLTGNATLSARQQTFPTSGTISEMWVNLSQAPGAGKSFTLTFNKNGVDQTQTVTISDSSTSASDTSHPISVSAGDLVSIKTSPANSPALITNAWVGFKFLPTVPGESVQLYGTAGLGTVNSTRWQHVISGSGLEDGASEAIRQQIVPAACTFKNFYATLANAVGSGNSVQWTLSVNGSQTGAPGCTISNTNTTCSDLVNSVAASPGDLVAYKIVNSAAQTPSGQSLGLVTFIENTPTPTPTPTATPTATPTPIRNYGSMTTLGVGP